MTKRHRKKWRRFCPAHWRCFSIFSDVLNAIYTLPSVWIFKSSFLCWLLTILRLSGRQSKRIRPVYIKTSSCTVLFEKPLFAVGLNFLLVVPGILFSNTPLWLAYLYRYSGYPVSCSHHAFTVGATDNAFPLFPFLACAILAFVLTFTLSVTQFEKMRKKIMNSKKLKTLGTAALAVSFLPAAALTPVLLKTARELFCAKRLPWNVNE